MNLRSTGLDLDIQKDNAQRKIGEKRPCPTPITYEIILLKVSKQLDFSSTQIILAGLFPTKISCFSFARFKILHDVF